MPQFLVIIEKANGNYAAYAPDLPGCVSTGKTLAQVRRRMRDAIKLHLAWLREEGLSIPDSPSLAEYMEFTLERIRSVSEEVRSYALEKYIEPARKQGMTEVKIKADEVHKALGLKNRVPLVCSALRSQRFEELAGVRRLEEEGSRFSTTTTLTFALESSPGAY